MIFCKTGIIQSNFLLINSCFLLILEIIYISIYICGFGNYIILNIVYIIRIILVFLIIIISIIIINIRRKRNYLSDDSIYFLEKCLTDANFTFSVISFLLNIIIFGYNEVKFKKSDNISKIISLTIVGMLLLFVCLLLIVNSLFMRKFAFERIETKDEISNINKENKNISTKTEEEKLVFNINDISFKFTKNKNDKKSILYFIYDKDNYNFVLCEHNNGHKINLENALFRMCKKHNKGKIESIINNNENSSVSEDVSTNKKQPSITTYNRNDVEDCDSKDHTYTK